jgi:hypothetical protein
MIVGEIGASFEAVSRRGRDRFSSIDLGLSCHLTRPLRELNVFEGDGRKSNASKYPPAKPGALGCEPLEAAMGPLTRPRFPLAA